MNAPQIIPCPVGFGKTADDLERTPELIDRMKAMGLPVSDFIMGQPDFTNRDAKQLRASQTDPDDPDAPRRIRNYIDLQIEKYQRIDITHWYANHEYEDHSGLKAVIDPADAKLTASWYAQLQQSFPHCPGSVYNALGVYANVPVTTQTSIDSFKLLDREIHMDWVYANGYIKGYPTPLEIALKNAQVVSQCERLAQGRPVMLACQTRDRILKTDAPIPMTLEGTNAWWASATALDVGYVIMYLPISERRNNERIDTFDDRIAELERLAPTITQAIESAKIRA